MYAMQRNLLYYLLFRFFIPFTITLSYEVASHCGFLLVESTFFKSKRCAGNIKLAHFQMPSLLLLSFVLTLAESLNAENKNV